MGKSNLVFLNFSDDKIDFIETTSLLALGTSIPIVPLPGMGAIILYRLLSF